VIGALTLLAQLASSAGGPTEVTGRSVRTEATDTLPAAGALVTLHRVGAARQGVLDSVVVGADGRFRFRAAVDSGDVLLVSGRWHGIEYFAPPVRPGMAVTVMVVDTSSSAVVGVSARHVIIGGPAADGTRDVVDLIVLRNGGTRTRVAGSDSAPTLKLAMPPHVANLTLGDADFAADAIDLHDDTLAIFAPVPPGERQLFVQYQLPPGARRLELPLDPRPDTLSLLAEEPGLGVPSTLVSVGSEEMNGRLFTRWAGRPDEAVVVELGDGGPLPGWLLPVLVGLLAIPLVVVTARVLLPRPVR
jgi:hypothetical protein